MRLNLTIDDEQLQKVGFSLFNDEHLTQYHAWISEIENQGGFELRKRRRQSRHQGMEVGDEQAVWEQEASDHLSEEETQKDWRYAIEQHSFKQLEAIPLVNWVERSSSQALTFATCPSAKLRLEPFFNAIHFLKEAKQQLFFSRYRRFIPFKKSASEQGYLSLKGQVDAALSQVNIQQAAVFEAMLMRLEAASQARDVTYRDVVKTMFTIGKTLKKTPSETLIPSKARLPDSARQDLREDTFLYFHDMLLTHGTASQKKRLYQCYWYKPGPNAFISTQFQKGSTYPVPTHLSKTLPQSLAKATCYNVAMINGLFARFQETLKKPLSITLLNIETDPTYLSLLMLEAALNQLSEFLESQEKTGFFRFFHWRHNQLLRQYRAQINGRRASRQWDMVHAYLKQLSSDLRAQLNKENDFTDEHQLAIERALKPLRRMVTSPSHQKTFDARVQLLKQTIEQLKTAQDGRESKRLCQKGIQHFKEGRLILALKCFDMVALLTPGDPTLNTYYAWTKSQIAYERDHVFSPTPLVLSFSLSPRDPDVQSMLKHRALFLSDEQQARRSPSPECLSFYDPTEPVSLGDRTLACLERAHQCDPKNTTLLQRIIQVLEEQSCTKKTHYYLDKWAELEPHNSEVLAKKRALEKPNDPKTPVSEKQLSTRLVPNPKSPIKVLTQSLVDTVLSPKKRKGKVAVPSFWGSSQPPHFQQTAVKSNFLK